MHSDELIRKTGRGTASLIDIIRPNDIAYVMLTKTFHYIMGSWYDEDTPESQQKSDESEDDDNFGDEGWYSSDRLCSRHSGTWWRGLLRGETMKGSKQGENLDGSDESGEGEEAGRTTDPKTPDKTGPPLFSFLAAGTGGSLAGNTRITSRRAAAEKEQQKRRKI